MKYFINYMTGSGESEMKDIRDILNKIKLYLK